MKARLTKEQKKRIASLAIKKWNGRDCVMTVWALRGDFSVLLPGMMYDDEWEFLGNLEIRNDMRLNRQIRKMLLVEQMKEWVMTKRGNAYLCKCNNCGTIFFDKKPNFDVSSKKKTPPNVKHLELLYDQQNNEYFWGCPHCKTDAYLIDI